MPTYEVLFPIMSGGEAHAPGATVELSGKDGADLEQLGAVRKLKAKPGEGDGDPDAGKPAAGKGKK